MTTKETGLDLEGLRLNPNKVAADIYKSHELIDALLSENERFRSALEQIKLNPNLAECKLIAAAALADGGA